jgi:hypothetical protein
MITIVSGLPRSGTSMVMQMLAAAPYRVLTDGVRRPDADNPRGYFEWEPIKQLSQQPQLLAELDEIAVKIVSVLLPAVPRHLSARVLFLDRPLKEIAASQAAMLRRSGREPALPGASLLKALEQHLNQVNRWLADSPNLTVLRLSYHVLLDNPGGECKRIQEFASLSADSILRMQARIDGSLYRQRQPHNFTTQDLDK